MRSSSRPRFTRAVLLQQFVEPFRRRGGDIVAILRESGLKPDVLLAPDRLIESSTFYSVLEKMAAALGDRYFCANVAREAALHGVPMLRQVADRARSLGEFLVGAMIETGRNSDNVAYSLNVTSEAAVFAIRRTRRLDRPTVQADAAGLAFYVTLFRLSLGEAFDPSRMLVATGSIDGVPPDILPGRAMACTTEAALSISFPPDWLSTPLELVWSTPVLDLHGKGAATADAMALPLLREAIRDNLASSDFDLGQLAQVCGTSPRRLQRILAANGTSFRSLRDEVRRKFSIEMVRHTTEPLQQIALRAGFSDVAAFSRSFRRWTCESPSAHRRRAELDAQEPGGGLAPAAPSESRVKKERPAGPL